ncbi:MAG: hypothetical protein FJ012_06065 [Chloroflexi bacterium]|nr:hypothetical protein [Chloroflexota bacterium]
MTSQTQCGEESRRNKNYANVRMTVTLAPVIFALDFGDLARALKKNGYDLALQVPPLAIGQRIGGSGIIAKKGNITIVADSERRYVGVDGTSLPDVLSSFDELTRIVKDDLWVDIRAKAAFYEAIVRMNVLGHVNPTETVESFFSNLDAVKALEPILGEPTSLFTIRLVPKGKLTGEQEWFEVKIEPDLARPDSTYMVEVVYRKSDYEKVKDFVSAIDQKIDLVLDKMEQKCP